MGLLIILFIGLVIFITLAILDFNYWYTEILFCISIVFSIFIGIGLMVVGTLSILTQCYKQKDYEKAIYERQVIEYRLEKQDDNLVGNELLYQDIVNYNNNLRNHKRYSDNFWLNWLYNDKIANIEYIELDGVENYPD